MITSLKDSYWMISPQKKRWVPFSSEGHLHPGKWTKPPTAQLGLKSSGGSPWRRWESRSPVSKKVPNQHKGIQIGRYTPFFHIKIFHLDKFYIRWREHVNRKAPWSGKMFPTKPIHQRNPMPSLVHGVFSMAWKKRARHGPHEIPAYIWENTQFKFRAR